MVRAFGTVRWQNNLPLDDRRKTREEIAKAYRSSCKTFEELLEMVASVDEEFLYHFSTSKMQYLKNGYQVRGRPSSPGHAISSCIRLCLTVPRPL